jgi:hypothetical protein
MTDRCHSEHSFLSFRAHARNPLHGCFASFSMTAVWSFRTLFFVIPSACEESIAWMLHFVQYDSRVVIPNSLFCHSERERGIHCMDASLAQHDKTEDVIPSALFCHSERERGIHCMDACAPFSMTRPKMSFRTLFFVIPSACEESIAWMLHFVQYDSRVVIPNSLFCHSERERGIHCMDASLAQHDKTEDVIPNTLFCHSERVRGIHCVDASLRSA